METSTEETPGTPFFIADNGSVTDGNGNPYLTGMNFDTGDFIPFDSASLVDPMWILPSSTIEDD